MIPKVYYDESGYLELMRDILATSEVYPDRTGVGCKKVFGASLVFDLRESFPRTSVRNTPLRFAFEEWMFFMRGQTDTKILEGKGIPIWRGNTTREFLDSRGLTDVHEGDMGMAYGFQFRHYSGHKTYFPDEDRTATWGGGIDQLEQVYHDLKVDPFSRRHYVTFWNPMQSHRMALLPCFHSHQFHVEKAGEELVLHLKVFSRSSDVLFGLPFNYTQYALYLQMMAESLGYSAGTLLISMTDSHVYQNQFEYAQETVEREIHDWRKRAVTFKRHLGGLGDILALEWSDVEDEGNMVNVTPYKSEKPPMAV